MTDAAKRKGAVHVGLEGEPADYAYWAAMETWTLKEACALLLGVDPLSARIGTDPASRYWRLRDALDRKFSPSTGNVSSPRINPSGIIEWARTAKLQVPEQFSQYFPKAAGKGSERTPSPGDLDKPLNAKSRRSYLRLIRGLLKGKYPTTFETISGGKLHADLEGLGVSMDKGVALEILRQARAVGDGNTDIEDVDADIDGA